MESAKTLRELQNATIACGNGWRLHLLPFWEAVFGHPPYAQGECQRRIDRHLTRCAVRRQRRRKGQR